MRLVLEFFCLYLGATIFGFLFWCSVEYLKEKG